MYRQASLCGKKRTLAIITQENLDKLIATNPGLGAKLLKGMLLNGSDRLRKSFDCIVTFFCSVLSEPFRESRHVEKGRGGEKAESKSGPSCSKKIMSLLDFTIDERGQITVKNKTADHCRYIDLTVERL